MDYLPFLRHQAVACLIGKIQGQLRLFVGIYIAGIHDKISGRQHSHRISLPVHQRLVTAVNIDIVNSLNLRQVLVRAARQRISRSAFMAV